MSLPDNCIILCKIDISRNFNKGRPITVTTAVAITVSVMVTGPVNPLTKSIWNTSLKDFCIILRKIDVSRNLDNFKLQILKLYLLL